VVPRRTPVGARSRFSSTCSARSARRDDEMRGARTAAGHSSDASLAGLCERQSDRRHGQRRIALAERATSCTASYGTCGTGFHRRTWTPDSIAVRAQCKPRSIRNSPSLTRDALSARHQVRVRHNPSCSIPG